MLRQMAAMNKPVMDKAFRRSDGSALNSLIESLVQDSQQGRRSRGKSARASSRVASSYQLRNEPT